MSEVKQFFRGDEPVSSMDTLLFVNDMVVRLGREQKAFQQRRADVRYPLSRAVMLAARQADRGEIKPLCEAWAIDLSYEGIGLLTEHDLMTGRQLHVQMADDSGATVSIPILSRTSRSGLRFMFDG